LYDRAAFQLPERRTPPEGAPSYAPTNWGELRNYEDIPKEGPLAEEIQRTLIHGYYAATSYMDAQLGKVLDELDRLNLGEKTIIVLWGDHGWHLGDHGMWCKHTNYEEAAHIPLIVIAPGVTTAKSETSALVETVDLYPTLCELTGVPAKLEFAGRSFVPTLKNPVEPTKDAIFHFFPRGANRLGRAVRTARHRLVEWKVPGAPPGTAEMELYDYESDPGETKNLASEEPQEVSRLRAILASLPEAKPQLTLPKDDKREAMFARRDKDMDGKLTREEFLLNQPDPKQAPDRFIKFDTDKDGLLSKEEFVTMGGTVNR
jgi:iduronate 2-sulfatase